MAATLKKTEFLFLCLAGFILGLFIWVKLDDNQRRRQRLEKLRAKINQHDLEQDKISLLEDWEKVATHLRSASRKELENVQRLKAKTDTSGTERERSENRSQSVGII